MRKFSFTLGELRKAIEEAIAEAAPGCRVYELQLKVPVVEPNKQSAGAAPPQTVRDLGIDWREEQRRMREEAAYIQQLGSGFAFMCSAQEKGAEPKTARSGRRSRTPFPGSGSSGTRSPRPSSR